LLVHAHDRHQQARDFGRQLRINNAGLAGGSVNAPRMAVLEQAEGRQSTNLSPSIS
jgi:hypothetical protein